MSIDSSSLETVVNEATRLQEAIASVSEWVMRTGKPGETWTLRSQDLEVQHDRGRLLLSCWGPVGSRLWRIRNWSGEAGSLKLEVDARFGASAGVIEMTPRASAQSVNQTIIEARLERCVTLAQLARTVIHGSKIQKARLSPGARPGQPGRYARIILDDGHELIAVTGSVAQNHRQEVDVFLSQSILWFLRAQQRIRRPFLRRLWIASPTETVEPLKRRVALLSEGLRNAIAIFEIDSDWSELTLTAQAELEELLSEPQEKLRTFYEAQPSGWAERITSLAPDAIDRIRGRHGETLRFNGLPFARVRTLMEREHAWFGVEASRRKTLDESTLDQFDALVTDLVANRDHEQTDKRNALYRALPEAWLESILRRDITRLDPGLIIAPIHTQFRTTRSISSGARPIDLLALRTDGRLVVIELKVSEDISHVLQGADYWLRIEAHRRQGNIVRAKIFGDREIAPVPPLVYLVGPTLRFHRAFETLAKSIRKEIEIYRFDINEDWRGGVRVMRRCDLT